ncbi:MAG: tripartite tricarboxylate transporter permease [Alphaproteobacteria bacterium]|nr:tripartite tricarboxylate transporter permease [Alphaproteobacteria bacterium]
MVAAIGSFVVVALSIIGLALAAPVLAEAMLTVGPASEFTLMALALVVVTLVSSEPWLKTAAMILLGLATAGRAGDQRDRRLCRQWQRPRPLADARLRPARLRVAPVPLRRRAAAAGAGPRRARRDQLSPSAHDLRRRLRDVRARACRPRPARDRDPAAGAATGRACAGMATAVVSRSGIRRALSRSGWEARGV